jgi:hypothetical protein
MLLNVATACVVGFRHPYMTTLSILHSAVSSTRGRNAARDFASTGRHMGAWCSVERVEAGQEGGSLGMREPSPERSGKRKPALGN